MRCSHCNEAPRNNNDDDDVWVLRRFDSVGRFFLLGERLVFVWFFGDSKKKNYLNVCMDDHRQLLLLLFWQSVYDNN